MMWSDRAGAAQAADRAVELALTPGPVRTPGLIVRATLHAIMLEHDRARALLREAAPFIAARPASSGRSSRRSCCSSSTTCAPRRTASTASSPDAQFEVLDLLPNRRRLVAAGVPPR